MDRPTVVIELADDPKLARDISAGGVFVPGCKLRINSECALVVRGAEQEIELAARVVYLDPQNGAGLELVNFTPALREHLTKIMAEWAPMKAAEEEPLDLGFDPKADEEPELSDEDKADPEKRRKALTMHERLRGLTLAQQIKVAQSPDPSERIMLERFYGKNVWEALLRNPRLTPPEVARIARMGTLPRTMIEIIVGNGAWLQMPEVRRALLSNPRLGTDQILRVLRLLPKHELKVASTGTAYPYAVRDCAKRIMKEQGNS